MLIHDGIKKLLQIASSVKNIMSCEKSTAKHSDYVKIFVIFSRHISILYVYKQLAVFT